MLGRGVDSTIDTSAPPTYSAQFNLPAPPGDAPPPPPDAGLRYAALEGKDRQSRLKNNRADSIDSRYAQDPVKLVSDIEREAERNRHNEEELVVLRKPGASAPAPAPSKSVPVATRSVLSTVSSEGPSADYLEPRPADPQHNYVPMGELPRAAPAKLNNGTPGRQTAPAASGDTKPKVPVKVHDSVRTNLDIFAPSQRRTPLDDGDTYQVPQEARRSNADPADTYVNMAPSVRNTAPPPTTTSANNTTKPKTVSSAVQNPEYFVPPSGVIPAPKATVDEDDDEDNDADQPSYVNLDAETQRRLLR